MKTRNKNIAILITLLTLLFISCKKEEVIRKIQTRSWYTYSINNTLVTSTNWKTTQVESGKIISISKKNSYDTGVTVQIYYPNNVVMEFFVKNDSIFVVK